jgi:hypothetical protein
MGKGKTIIFVDVPRSRDKIIRVSLDVFQGHHGGSVRTWFPVAQNELRPSAKGIWIPVRLFPSVMKALKRLHRRARKMGMLTASKARKAG